MQHSLANIGNQMVAGKELLLLRMGVEMPDCDHCKQMGVKRGNDLDNATKEAFWCRGW
jgi:hypothetical protein